MVVNYEKLKYNLINILLIINNIDNAQLRQSKIKRYLRIDCIIGTYLYFT